MLFINFQLEHSGNSSKGTWHLFNTCRANVTIRLTKFVSRADFPLEFEDKRLFQLIGLPIEKFHILSVALCPEIPYITFSTLAFEV